MFKRNKEGPSPQKRGTGKFLKPLRNQKGFILIQALGLAAVAIVLLSSMYRTFDDNWETWLGAIDNGMTNIFDQSTVGGSGGSGGSGGGGGSTPIVPGGPDLNPEGTVPNGSYYFSVLSQTQHDEIPETAGWFDIYISGDYIYSYANDMWQVHVITSADVEQVKGYFSDFSYSVPDKTTRTTYGPILESINGAPIEFLANTFEDCTALTEVPAIPDTVIVMMDAFNGCTSLVDAPSLPSGVRLLRRTFEGCTSLENAPIIPSTVTDMHGTFSGCTALTGEVEINTSTFNTDDEYSDCFKDTVKPITITGSTTLKAELAATANNGNVSY